MQHRKAANICHVCGKEIKDKAVFEKHVRLHFEDSGPRIKCPRPDCESWLKDEDNLKQHLRRHNDEGKSFICSECGKSCKNSRALIGHKRYSHSNTIYTCEQCGKTFKKDISLKVCYPYSQDYFKRSDNVPHSRSIWLSILESPYTNVPSVHGHSIQTQICIHIRSECIQTSGIIGAKRKRAALRRCSLARRCRKCSEMTRMRLPFQIFRACFRRISGCSSYPLVILLLFLFLFVFYIVHKNLAVSFNL